MSSYEEKVKTACKELDIPGIVCVATDKKGDFVYKEAFGTSSLKDGEGKPLRLDSTFWIASCTKLMTTIAAMQCVERGQFSLDADVSGILDEFKDIEILTGFEEGSGKPVMKKAEKKVTLRLLLTHSSGMAYDVFDPTLMKWRAYRGESVALGDDMPMLKRITTPLLYEPGTSWSYSTGIDWAGQMVARANNTNLQAYMQKNMWEPLGIKNITFHLDQRPDMKERKPAMSKREGGVHPMFGTTLNPRGKVEHTEDKVFADPLPEGDEFGGAGAYASPVEYLKILHSILANDGKLLKPSTVDDMFKPQLSSGSQQAFMSVLTLPEMNDAIGGLPMGLKLDWGIGGLITLEDMHTGRKKGSMAWSGLPNLIWWVDREGGLAGLSATQIIPPGDPKAHDWHYAFEKETYERLRKGTRL